MEQQGDYITEVQEALDMLEHKEDTQQHIYDDSDLRHYRIELPNLYDDADLDPYEFRLLAHYKRVGRCTEGTRTTAKICKMGVMTVSEKRQSLHDKGFIALTSVPLEGGGFSYIVTVVDKWQENFLKYSAMRKTRTPGVHPYTPDVHPRTPHDNKESDDEALSKITRAYESEIGIITSMIADDLKDASTTYPLKWVLDAIHEAAIQNKRGWKYCLSILKRWQAQGHQGDDKNKQTPAPSVPDFGDWERQYA